MGTVYADERLSQHLKGDMLYIYLIGAATGLRVSDILSLRVKQLYIGKPTIKEQKTGKSKRIYIPAEVKRKLIERAEKRGDSKSDFVFKSPADPEKPLSRQAVWKAFKKAESKIDGAKKDVGTHSMRKAYAKRLLRKGKKYKEIQVKMNHDSIGDTLRYLIDKEGA